MGARAAIWISALLLVVAVGMMWAAKPSEQRIKIYNSVEACRVEQPAEDCAKAFAAAQEEQAKTAPRFAARELCEAQYGSCGALHDGTGDWFVPAIIGFMLGRALGTGGVASVVSQPVYVDHRGTAYTGGSPIGAYRSRCAVNPDDPYCRGGGGFGGGGGFVYASSGTGGGSSSASSVWSSKSYAVESVRTSVMRGGFGSSASSAPSSSFGVASAPNAASSSSVTRGGFGMTASLHGVGS